MHGLPNLKNYPKALGFTYQTVYRYMSLNDGGYVLRNVSLGVFVVMQTS